MGSMDFKFQHVGLFHVEISTEEQQEHTSEGISTTNGDRVMSVSVVWGASAGLKMKPLSWNRASTYQIYCLRLVYLPRQNVRT